MLNLNKILEKVDGKDEIIKQIEAELGKEYVPRSEFNSKNEELKTANSTIKERDKQLEDLSTAEGDKAAMQRQLKELKEANKKAAAEYEEKVKNLRLDAEIDKAIGGQFMPDALDFIKTLIKKDSIIINEEDGTILGLKEQVEAIRESKKSLLAQSEAPEGPQFSRGSSTSTPPTMTKDQILAIPNTLDRQRAIAENINLFEGGN